MTGRGSIQKKVTNSLPGSNTKVICNHEGSGDCDDKDYGHKIFLGGENVSINCYDGDDDHDVMLM